MQMHVEFVIAFNPKSQEACSFPAPPPPTTVLEIAWVMYLFGVTIACRQDYTTLGKNTSKTRSYVCLHNVHFNHLKNKTCYIDSQTQLLKMKF